MEKRTRKTNGLTGASTVLSAVSLAALVGVALGADSSGDGYYQFMRPRTGYFSRYDQSSPYARIYEQYFEHVIKKNDRALDNVPNDDWRRVRPSGELCVDFLIGLQVKSYIMSKPYELIILDACLDWLFDRSDSLRSEEQQKDVARLDSSRKVSLKSLEADTRLRQVYENTRFKQGRSLPARLQEQIYEYAMRLLQVYSANPRNGCHSLWLEAYNDFIDDVYVGDCEDEANCEHFGLADSERDTYLAMVLESTREASRTCYGVMQKQIRGLMENEFEQSNSGPTSIKKHLLSKSKRVARQSEREKWARQMIAILQLASDVDSDTPVSLADVVETLYKIKNGDQALTERFLTALGDYATANGDLRDSSNDQYGRGRFGRAMIKLCGPYTDKRKFLSMTGGINMDNDPSERQPFDFYGLVYSLVRLTNHEKLLDITKDHFEQEVIANRWEALYLATFACQVISASWGELDYGLNTQAFKVLLRPEFGLMVADWPLEIMRVKLPELYPKSGSIAHKRPDSSGPARKPTAFFGKKFKLNFGNSFNANEAAGDQADHTAAPTPAPVVESAGADKPAERKLPSFGKSPVGSGEPPRVPSAAASQPASPPPPVSALLPAPQESKIMSWESIEMFRKVHGKYPQLPDFYKKIYPQLPDDLNGHYPVEMGKAAQKQPASLSSSEGRFAKSSYGSSPMPEGRYTSSYGSSPMSEGRYGQSYGGSGPATESRYGPSSYGQSSHGQSSFGQSGFGHSPAPASDRYGFSGASNGPAEGRYGYSEQSRPERRYGLESQGRYGQSYAAPTSRPAQKSSGNSLSSLQF